MSQIKRIMLLILGTVSFIIAIIGIILPLIPTTPLLLVTAACYLRASERMYNWLINNKYFGKHILRFKDGKGIPLKTKVFVITLLWISIMISVVLFIPLMLVKLLLIAIAISITWYISSIKTLKEE